MDENIEKQVLKMIVDTLSIDDVDIDNFDYDMPLFAASDPDNIGLGLDSVDALELFVGLKSKFGVKATEEDMRSFKTVRTIADFLRANKKSED